MSRSTRQLRYNGMLQANLEKIINEGIRYNLKRLDQCSHNIAKYKSNNQDNELKREYMNGRLLIQRLELSVTELQNCYNSMRDVDVDGKYEKLVGAHKKQVRERIDFFTNANKAATDDELNDHHPHNDESQHSIANLGMQIHEDAAKLVDSKERLRKVQALNEDIQDLNAIAVNIATLVHEQQEAVDHIEQNVSQAADSIEEGTKSLIQASAYSVAPITCAALGGAVFGPVGAVVGLKLSTGIISALGGSAATYTLAKFLQNRKKAEAKKDLKAITSK